MDTLQSRTDEPRSKLEREIAALDPWFHNLHLPGGAQTAPAHPLGDFPTIKWQSVEPHLPENLEGWTALDVGCNAGFYSFELAARGARVTAVEPDPHYLKQARWVAEKYGLADRVRFRREQVYDLLREERRYDLVWFMGVFYHLRYPQVALDLLASLTNKLLVFQTLQIPDDQIPALRGGQEAPSPIMPAENVPLDLPFHECRRLAGAQWPKLTFIEHSFAGDATNWWIGDGNSVPALLHSAGLEIITKAASDTYICRPDARHPQNGPPNANARSQLHTLQNLARSGEPGQKE